MRSFNDWYMRYWLESVPGVAEVATVGGFVKQYQVNVDPVKLVAYGIPLNRVIEAVRGSNSEVGGGSLEMSGKEYLVRGRGYIRSISDIQKIPLGSDGRGTPVYVQDVARVELGPEMRRGMAELNGEGEVTGGTVVVRYRQNVMDVIKRVKAKARRDQTQPAARC
jgi:Cu(I)/Ag(I) efflux system membrane protein CusA/SilA